MDLPDFSLFTSSVEPVIANTATYIQGIKTDMDEHHITAAEFQELALDALNYAKVTQDIQELQRQEQIKEAFDTMISIVSFIIGAVPIKL